jgi:hypothetical protein
MMLRLTDGFQRFTQTFIGFFLPVAETMPCPPVIRLPAYP